MEKLIGQEIAKSKNLLIYLLTAQHKKAIRNLVGFQANEIIEIANATPKTNE